MAKTLILFAEKIWVAFYSHFCSKNINVFEYTLATTVDKFLLMSSLSIWCVEQLGPGFIDLISFLACLLKVQLGL